MSSLFSIGDTDFDDLEDEEFFIETCLDSNQPRNLFSNTKHDGKEASYIKSDQNISFQKINDKLNNLRSFASSKNLADSVAGSSAKIAQPLSLNLVNGNKYNQESPEKEEHLPKSIQDGPPTTRHISSFNGFSSLNSAKSSNFVLNGINKGSYFHVEVDPGTLCSKDNSGMQPQSSLDVSSQSVSTLSGGLRYTQNMRPAVLSPATSHPLSTCVDHSRNRQGKRLHDSECKSNVESSAANKALCTTSRTLPLPDCSNKYFQTDWSPNVCISSPSVKKDLVQYAGIKSRYSGDTPRQASKPSLLLDAQFSTPKMRRFPGPAGILPRLEPGQKLDNLPSPCIETPKRKSPDMCQLINHDAHEFSTEPWTIMQDAIAKRFSSSIDSLASVVKKAATQQLDKGKVAYLGVLVKSFCFTGLDVSVVLKDPSGEMRGSLHRKVLEKHQSELGPGCGLFLKQVSVFSPSPRKHYLNITPGNIMEVFPVCDDTARSSQKASEATPKRNSHAAMISRHKPRTEEETHEDSQQCKDDFEALLEGLDADEDILAEAMNF